MPIFGTPTQNKYGIWFIARFESQPNSDPGAMVIQTMDRQGQPKVITLNNTITERNYSCTSGWYEKKGLRKIVDLAEPGDILEFERVICYNHFAVFLGASNSENEKLEESFVCHFSNNEDNPRKSMNVHVERLVDVLFTSRIRINNEFDQRRNPACQHLSLNGLVERIDHFSGHWPRYQIVFNNCEHFATYCRYEDAFSSQSSDRFEMPDDFEVRHIVPISTAGGGVGLFIKGTSAVIMGLGYGAFFGISAFALYKSYQFIQFLSWFF